MEVEGRDESVKVGLTMIDALFQAKWSVGINLIATTSR